ncbi:MAG: FprA family A-type flavoprotein, partial [Methanosphaera sp.]|nr:FprA family A-type flavoprotein [Methanosphaera sp.]
PYPKIGNLLSYLECMSPANTGVRKKAALFSSKGWAGGAIPKLTSRLTEAGFDVLGESVEEIYVPDENDMEKCYELGKKLAQMIKE